MLFITNFKLCFEAFSSNSVRLISSLKSALKKFIGRKRQGANKYGKAIFKKTDYITICI